MIIDLSVNWTEGFGVKLSASSALHNQIFMERNMSRLLTHVDSSDELVTCLI